MAGLPERYRAARSKSALFCCGRLRADQPAVSRFGVRVPERASQCARIADNVCREQ